MRVEGVVREYIPMFWPLVEDYFARVEQDDFSLEELRELAISRKAQLWLFCDGMQVIGAMLTEIIVFPRKKVLRPIIADGAKGLRCAKATRDVVFEWAKAQGCVEVEVIGRPGWEWIFHRAGVKMKKQIVLRGAL